MPIYSEPGNFSPALFDTKFCNCYRIFNDAYETLEQLILSYIRDKRFDGGLIDEARKDFMASYIILGDDDRSAAVYRNVFAQYAFISGMLQDNAYAARAFEQRLIDRRAFTPDEFDFYMDIAAAAQRPGESSIIEEEFITPIGNLAMFVATTRGYVLCDSSVFTKLTPNDFLLRYILATARDGSPLLDFVGQFSWFNLPQEYMLGRPNIFLPVLDNCHELDVGRHYVLKTMLNAFKGFALDPETAEWYKLGYRFYNQLYEDSTKILDDKAREFELYLSYQAERPVFPETWHFKRLSDAFAKTPAVDFIQAAFIKNGFSRHEVELMESAAAYHKDYGFINSLLDQIYYFSPIKNYSGTQKIWFHFPGYPRVIRSDFTQYSETASNYFWLPEAPSKVLNEKGEEFLPASRIKKYRPTPSAIKFEGGGAYALEEPFRGMYMYGYGVNLLGHNPDGDIFKDNPAFGDFVEYLRNLPKDMAKKAAQHLLKQSAYLEPEHSNLILNQLIYISPNADTLKRIAAQGTNAGKHAAALLETLMKTIEMPAGGLLAVLGQRDFSRLVSTLVDFENGTVYYNELVAKALENEVLSGKKLDGDGALYLGTSYAMYDYRSVDTSKVLNAAASRFISGEEISLDVSIRFLNLYINEKINLLSFDNVFFEAVSKLWELSDKRGIHKDEVCSVLWRLLALGDMPSFGALLPYYEEIARSAVHDSCVITEFILYRKLMDGKEITPEEASHIEKLYKAQRIVTARTKTVASAIHAGQWLAEELVAYEWIDTNINYSDVYVSEAVYDSSALPSYEEFDFNTDIKAEQLTRVFRVGYVNVFTLNYIYDGERVSRIVKRKLAEDAFIRDMIFQKARKGSDQGSDSGFVLLAGRMCVDGGHFMGDVLFDYIDCLYRQNSSGQEFAKAAAFVISKENDLVKTALFSEDKESMTIKLKRFYQAILESWDDFKGRLSIANLFAYIRSLERITGGEITGLDDYLSEVITQSPNIPEELLEDYKTLVLKSY